MINPSAHGWIEKYFVEQNKVSGSANADSLTFYRTIRETGFIYGHIIGINNNPDLTISNWKTEEVSKVALLAILYDLYCFSTDSDDVAYFIQKALDFYHEMKPQGFSFLSKFISSTPSSKLEHLIDERVQTNKDIISKNFSHIV